MNFGNLGNSFSNLIDTIKSNPFFDIALIFGLVAVIVFCWIAYGLYKSGEEGRKAIQAEKANQKLLAKAGEEAIARGEELSETDPRKVAFNRTKLGRGALIAVNNQKDDKMKSNKADAATQIFNPSQKSNYRPVENLGGPTLQDYYTERGGVPVSQPAQDIANPYSPQQSVVPPTPPVPSVIAPPSIAPVVPATSMITPQVAPTNFQPLSPVPVSPSGMNLPAVPNGIASNVSPTLPPLPNTLNRPTPVANPDLQKLLDDDNADTGLLDKLRKGDLN